MSINWFEPYRVILNDPRIIDGVRNDPLVSDARRFSPATYADMFAWNALDAAAAFRAPVLVLAARGDRLQPLAQSEILASALPRPTGVRVLETSSHVPNLESPHLLAPILLDWFSSTGLMAATPSDESAAEGHALRRDPSPMTPRADGGVRGGQT